MFAFLRKHHKLVLASMALCIVGLLLFGAGGGSLAPSPHDAVLKINGTKVAQADYDQLYQQIARQRDVSTPEQQRQVEADTIQELIRIEVFSQEAKKYGIEVPDQDLQQQIMGYPAFQKEGKFDGQQYVQTVTQGLGMSIPEFERARRKDIIALKLTSLLNASVHVPSSVVQAAIPSRLAIETDKTKKKELQENPDLIRDELRNREANLVFADWLNQVNSNLMGKIVPISEDMKRKLGTQG